MALTKKLQVNRSKQEYKASIICTHCHKKITTAKIKGLSLVCPFCDRPSDELDTLN